MLSGVSDRFHRVAPPDPIIDAVGAPVAAEFHRVRAGRLDAWATATASA
jgi:hypothetical protein